MWFQNVSRENWYQYALFAVNGVLAVFGAVLILWGTLTIIGAGDFEGVDNTEVSTATLPILAILLGIAVLVVGVLAIVGIAKKNFYITVSYAAILFVITVLTVILFIWMHINRNDFYRAMDRAVQESFERNNRKNGYPFDPLEITFECCGLDDYSNYKTVPKTCCGFSRSDKKGKCTRAIYEERPGCRIVVERFWQSNIQLVSWLGVFVILIELVTLGIAIWLVRRFRNSGEVDLEGVQPQQPSYQNGEVAQQ